MTIDLLFAGILVYVMWRGFHRGFIDSVFWLCSILVGMAAALSLSHWAAQWVEWAFHIRSEFTTVLSFILVLSLVMGLFYLFGNAIENLLQKLNVGFLNHMAGALIWGFSWALLASSLLWYSNNLGLVSETQKQASRSYSTLILMAPATMETAGKLIPATSNLFQQLQEWFNQNDQKLPEPSHEA